MTRPPLRDVVFGGLLVANGSLLAVHLWIAWRGGASLANTTAVLACSAGLALLIWSRELVDLQLAVFRAQLRKWDADAHLAEHVWAQVREAERHARPLTLPLQPPLSQH